MTHAATQRVFEILTADPQLSLMQAVYGQGGEIRLAVFELAGDFVLVAAHKVPGPFEDEPGNDEVYLPDDEDDSYPGGYDPDNDIPGE